MGKSQELYQKAKKLIPGGTQLLSKRPEMFLPDLWPAYYSKAKGCEIWDLDDIKYFDMVTMGIGACILGYADDDVNFAVKKAVDNGNMCLLNAPEEVELAEVLCNLHPWASMVRYTRSGGEAMAVAVRIARAFTQKDIVLFCGYHGWHDWYLAANLGKETALDGHLLPGLEPRGVPRALTGTAYPFIYNDIEGFLRLIKQHAGRVGVVVLETIRNQPPTPEFLATLRAVTQKNGIVFVVDEITAGWRMNLGGSHLLYDVKPDIAVFGKAMGNGYPMGAIIGTSEVMSAAQESFISSTYWTERIGPVAALATIKKLQNRSVPAHLCDIGKRIQEGWRQISKGHQLGINISGILPLGHFSFDHAQPLVLKTLFTQEMLTRGFLASTVFYASLAHSYEVVDQYLNTADEVFGFIAKAVATGQPEKHLKSSVCHAGFRRLA
ncbi:MAG: aminotransferase class III-fold pyridoxal phosphate-dependent enzyme [Proteobacteria bacterium]|nr:aminotransferase class III-fold pyridoxal phosphate-dependent enzyme [Pseudomonadota bacterium]MBU1688668.1 aminotransferase class III-fold pyridoxal phosphate-dependent enzyme [Pseudomonadota bacterium]